MLFCVAAGVGMQVLCGESGTIWQSATEQFEWKAYNLCLDLLLLLPLVGENPLGECSARAMPGMRILVIP